MATVLHFIDVGQGNMTLIETADRQVVLYDCNIKDDNADRVLAYVLGVLNGRAISTFVNSHRDADHMRGIRRLHRVAPIGYIADCGVAGNTDCDEYGEFMRLRNEVGSGEVRPGVWFVFGGTRFYVLAGRDPRSYDTNAQSAVLKVEDGGFSAMLTGDSDVRAWRWITANYSEPTLKSTVLLASHHGAVRFFREPASPATIPLRSLVPPPDIATLTLGGLVTPRRRPLTLGSLASIGTPPPLCENSPLSILARLRIPVDEGPFVRHLELIKPQATVVSVGPNSYGHPEAEALRLYNQYTSDPPAVGLPRVCRTDVYGTLRLELSASGWWLKRG